MGIIQNDIVRIIEPLVHSRGGPVLNWRCKNRLVHTHCFHRWAQSFCRWVPAATYWRFRDPCNWASLFIPPRACAGYQGNSRHPNYIVIYQVLSDCIEVLAVLHARQEYPWLFREYPTGKIFKIFLSRDPPWHTDPALKAGSFYWGTQRSATSTSSINFTPSEVRIQRGAFSSSAK